MVEGREEEVVSIVILVYSSEVHSPYFRFLSTAQTEACRRPSQTFIHLLNVESCVVVVLMFKSSTMVKTNSPNSSEIEREDCTVFEYYDSSG